jgi:hypothetical protein
MPQPWEKYAQNTKTGKPWERYAQKQTGFTDNPKGEGLYRMSQSPASEGEQDVYVSTTQPEIKVPFGRVQDALNAGYRLHFDEKPRYQKDQAHQGEGPTLLEKADTAIQGVLAPTPQDEQELPSLVPNVSQAKAIGRTLYATPGFIKAIAIAAFDPETVRDSRGTAILNTIDPTQVPAQLQEQFQEDVKKSPSLAVNNLIGSLEGMGLISAITHGASGAVKSISKVPGAEGVRGAIRDTLGVTENTEKTVEKFGKDTEVARKQNKIATEQTLKQRGAADKVNKKSVDKQATDLRKHNEEVAKIAKEHREKVAKQTQEHADALQKHQDETKDVQGRNVKTLQDHLETTAKIAKDNQAAEDAIKARQTGEQQVATDTTEFHKRIKDAETAANAVNDAAWDTVRNVTSGQEGDISNLKKVVEVAKTKADPTTSPIFNSILNEGEGAGVDPQGRPIVGGKPRQVFVSGKEVPLSDPNYAKYYELQFREPPPLSGAGGKAAFGRLQRWYTYIQNKMYGGRGWMEAGSYNALQMTRDAINDAMHDITNNIGNVPDPRDSSKTVSATSLLDDARKIHTEKMEAFSNSPSESATVATAYEKAKTPEAVKKLTEEEWGKKLEAYDPEITRLGESITKAKEGLKDLPTEDQARKMAKPFPAPPTPEPLPKAPETPEPLAGPEYPVPPTQDETKPYAEPKPNQPLPSPPNIQAENIEYINNGLRKYGKVGGWVLRLIAGGLAEHLAHGSVSVFSGNLLVGQTAVTLLTKALRSPSMLEWLSKPSAEDLKLVESLPPQDAARMRQAIGAMATEEVKNNPSLSKTKIAPAMTAWLSGQSVGQPAGKSVDEVKKEAEHRQKESSLQHEDAKAEIPPELERIKKALNVRLKVGQPYGDAVASVGQNEPNVIEINDPKRFAQGSQQTIAHELTHLLFNNLAGPLRAKIPPDNARFPYDISHVDELRKKGYKLWNLPQEVAATVVQTWVANPSERERLQPWIEDFNNAPLSVEEPTPPNAKGIVSAIRPPSPPIEGYISPEQVKEKAAQLQSMFHSAGMAR